MDKAIEDVILNAVAGRYQTGDTFRLRHKACTDKDKDPAMNVNRGQNGWAWYCHRCGEGGYIFDSSLSPTQTAAKIAANKEPINKVTEHITLPLDFEPIKGDRTCTVPYAALHWLWQYSLTNEEIMKFNIGWSGRYKRVIIPLYEFAYMGDEIARKLVGWVGREVKYKTKEERKKAGVTKYRTRAKKGKRRHFVCPGEQNTVVIVEDCISAMKVNIATGYTTVALLNTSVGTDLMRWLRGKKIYLWLDGDMLASGVKQVNRMRSLGLAAYHVYTSKDPKEYNPVAIREQLENKAQSGVKSDT
jgi:hypothetical protein